VFSIAETDAAVAPVLTPLVRDLPTALERAQRAFERGHLREAIELLEQALVLDASHIGARTMLAVAYARTRRVEQALERVGMSHRARHMPGQLSGGQQQRVAVARAVAGDPLILLADEPTGNLDSKNGQSVMKLLSELHRAGSTLIMVTHDPAYARLATRTVTLFDGRIVDEGQNLALEA